MKKNILAISTAVMAFSMTSVAQAQTKLTLSSWLPPTHPVVSEMIQPWMEQVETATEGRVTIQMLAKPLGHPKVHYDIARDGMADITYSAHGYTPGRFTLTKVSELPFSGDSAEATSVAYWKIHEKYFTQANEYKGTQLLSLFTHGPGMVHNSKRPIKTLEDFDGLKMRVGGGIANDVASQLGIVPILKPSSASYELLSRGVADGILFPMESVPAFKLDDIVTHTTMIPGGLYNISFFLVMNKDRFKSLSEADQAAIMRVSGAAFSRLSGQVWDKVDKAATVRLKEKGNDIQTADATLMQAIKEKTQNIEADWIKDANKKGVDGAAALAEFKALVEAYQPASQ